MSDYKLVPVGWQPIETAPHGEEVLLGWLEWDGAWKMEVSQASWGWSTKTASNISRHGQATHWMPLPDAPQSSEPPAALSGLPGSLPMEPYQTVDRSSPHYKAGWNACRRAMLAAAPAVQGELVGWQFYKHGKWWNGDILTKNQRKNIEEEGVRVRNVYAAPQPSTDVAGLVESVWMYKGNDGEWKPFMNEQHRLNTLADGGWDVREFFTTSCQENLQPAEQHPAPDVSELVEALEYLMGKYPASRHLQDTCAAALAAYRKGGA